MIKNKKRIYWVLTISGWLIFGLFKSYLSPFWDAKADVYSWVLPTFTLINPFVMLLLTHGYKYIAHHFKLLNLSFPKTIVVILCASLILISMFLVFKLYISSYIFNAICFLLQQPIYDPQANTPQFLELPMRYVYPYMYTLECMSFTIWLSLFHAYYFFENAQIKTAEQYASKIKLQEAELSFLRTQLNPHFLFNALNSIHALSLMQSEKASDAVILLSDLMRYTLNYGKKNLVSLEEELNIVKKYLELETIRFGKKLKYEFDISQESLAVLVPPIIVQTITENAIKHAIRQNKNGGIIKIKSTIKDAFLRIDIINNGQLMPKENTKTDPSVLEHSEGGIGIENTEKRLHMLYGDKASFELKNANEEEVVAQLRIPVS
jgi:two-component system, LytTR family, sensor kinase